MVDAKLARRPRERAFVRHGKDVAQIFPVHLFHFAQTLCDFPDFTFISQQLASQEAKIHRETAMITIRSALLGLAAAGTFATVLPAASHEQGLPAAVKARHAQMQLYAFNLGTLGAMAQDKMDYDAEAASAAASNIVKLSSLAAGPMWAPGTSADDVDGSRALPAIWTDMDGVIEKAVALNEAAVAMEAAAGEGLDSLKSAFGPLGGACGDCHKAYRQPE